MITEKLFVKIQEDFNENDAYEKTCEQMVRFVILGFDSVDTVILRNLGKF